jgi:putative nucleotidyltransferase with HDIG domain
MTLSFMETLVVTTNDNGPFRKKSPPGNPTVAADTDLGAGLAVSTMRRGRRDDFDSAPCTKQRKAHPAVLIVEDEAGPRDALRLLLDPFYKIQTADNARTALQALHEQPVDLITLDQKLPDRDGIALLKEIMHDHPEVEVIIITGNGNLSSAIEGARHGAAGYLLKPFNVNDLLTLMKETWEKKQRLDFLREYLRSSTALWGTTQESVNAWKEMQIRYFSMDKPRPGTPAAAPDAADLLPFLCDLLEAKDRQLLAHCSRVNFYATLLATRLRLTKAEQKTLTLGAFLHDIGKIHIDKDAFSRDQTADLGDPTLHNRHADIGARIVLQLGLPAEVGQIIACHYTWYDGSGAPSGLKGEGIPLLSRIVCLAEAFDCLTAEVSGRLPMAIDAALRRISGEAGIHFDPILTKIFTRAIMECKESLPALALAPLPTDI